jgi:hypothetical protein
VSPFPTISAAVIGTWLIPIATTPAKVPVIEIQDMAVDGGFHDLNFGFNDSIVIAVTRS